MGDVGAVNEVMVHGLLNVTVNVYPLLFVEAVSLSVDFTVNI